jgi:hypothetical protein
VCYDCDLIVAIPQINYERKSRKMMDSRTGKENFFLKRSCKVRKKCVINTILDK